MVAKRLMIIWFGESYYKEICEINFKPASAIHIEVLKFLMKFIKFILTRKMIFTLGELFFMRLFSENYLLALSLENYNNSTEKTLNE